MLWFLIFYVLVGVFLASTCEWQDEAPNGWGSPERAILVTLFWPGLVGAILFLWYKGSARVTIKYKGKKVN